MDKDEQVNSNLTDTNIILVSVAHEVQEWFYPKAFEKARRDFNMLFLQAFSKARTLATSKAENGTNQHSRPKIDMQQWREAYWGVLEAKKRHGRYGYLKVSLRWMNRVIPFILGFLIDPKLITAPSQANTSAILPILIISFIYWITTFVEEKLEAEK